MPTSLEELIQKRDNGIANYEEEIELAIHPNCPEKYKELSNNDRLQNMIFLLDQMLSKFD